MTERQHNQTQDDGWVDPSRISDEQLIRMAADQELRPELQARFDELVASDGGADAAVRFERELREACGRAMRDDCPPVPAGLMARCRAAVAEASREDEAVAEGLVARADETREQSFWAAGGPIMRSLGAIAATMLLAFVVWQMSQPATTASSSYVEAAGFVSGEHNRCRLNPDTTRTKFTVTEAEAVPERFADLTGRALSLSDLLAASSAGLRFVEAGTCHVPGRAPSMHLTFSSDGTSCPKGSSFSLFVQAAGSADMAEGETYVLHREDDDPDHPTTVYGWTRDGLTYYLVGTRTDAMDQFCEALGQPLPAGQI
ncbi:MAG: hypothetical protein AAGG07_07585 [Planctomycetota bacterium]